MSFEAWRQQHGDTLRRLHASSGAARWGVSEDAYAEMLFRSVTHRFGGGPLSSREVREYLEALHAPDLALACACRAGHPDAWDHFVRELRPDLYAAARAIAGDEYRELADSLYAELYGLAERDGERRSLLTYYHGRSRLTTWLRSVLVQRQIDRKRANARLEQLDPSDPDEPLAVTGAASTAAGDRLRPPGGGGIPDVGLPEFERRRFVSMAQSAIDAAIAALDDRSRLRLRLYYGEDLTLGQVGRVTGESEATVSRKLDRARRELRRLVEKALRAEHGLAADAIAECFELAARAPELELTRLLSRAEDG